MANEVELHRWLLSRPKVYLTKGAMLQKLLWIGVVLAVLVGLGAAFLVLNEPRVVPSVQEKRLGKEVIQECCLQDIRSVQEALTGLSIEIQKLQVRLSTSKEQSNAKILMRLASLAEQPRSLWDQLESFLADPNENKRRQLRDIRINMEGLKEQFEVAETCCGQTPAFFSPLMKEYLQIAVYRFGVAHYKIETSYRGEAAEGGGMADERHQK